jgi:hypothetical protein
MNDLNGLEAIFPLAARVIGRSLDDPEITDPIQQVLFPFVLKLYSLREWPKHGAEPEQGELMLLRVGEEYYFLEWDSPDELKITLLVQTHDSKYGEYPIFPPPHDEYFNPQRSMTPLGWTFKEGLSPLVFPVLAESYIVGGRNAGRGKQYLFDEDGSIRNGPIAWIS